MRSWEIVTTSAHLAREVGRGGGEEGELGRPGLHCCCIAAALLGAPLTLTLIYGGISHFPSVLHPGRSPSQQSITMKARRQVREIRKEPRL